MSPMTWEESLRTELLIDTVRYLAQVFAYKGRNVAVLAPLARSVLDRYYTR